ncbi:uncharacterized protein LOC112350880 [Selaginella moellendorffii]|uniref:uncharacterized protein LOC112350880 n=1 Tax=Selaginella moellendorffii TaxID=88036 RepID=UPI000D1C3A6B|nr:uncharacterized protein LOC112350880 [Selaginella moellendorffii]|eukprot:XP_024543628.1 uncharacterized protein LOC112350880 [Selaginella moellendorffii]
MVAGAPLDFRFLDEGLGGAKNKKRKRDADQVAIDVEDQQQEEKRQAMAEGDSREGVGAQVEGGEDVPRVSAAGERRGQQPGGARHKRIAAEFRERKQQLKEQIRANKKEAGGLQEEEGGKR